MDVIIVLGSILDKNGYLTDIGSSRVEKAIELYKKEKCKIIMSGHSSIEIIDAKKTEAQAMEDYAIMHGVNKEYIIKEESSRDTIGNAFFSKEIIDKNKWTSLVVVTSDFHITRSSYIFKKIFSGSYKIKLVSVTSLEDRSKKEKELLEITKKLLENISNEKQLKEFIFDKYFYE
ncbi:MAG: YdcF family protein [Candidatus Aenigmarchaeota archaeon]|nr:YdcF family protein [Candidatus Aenigmarchaeota archaeon]